MIIHLIKYKKRIKTIGVKSIGQIVVGTMFFIKLYNGSSISPINFGLNLIHTNGNHESIISIKIT